MLCDMCGSSGKLYKAMVEGALLTVCDNCSKLGKITATVKTDEKIRKKPRFEKKIVRREEPEIIEIIAENYAEKIKTKRESLNLTQKQFAEKINEKESVIQNLESGSFSPPINLAKKIEHFLKIKLVEVLKEEQQKISASEPGSLTIGDFIKIKKK